MPALTDIGEEMTPDQWIALHAIGTGMVPAPPRANFSSLMDPNERAAYRTREAVQPGRPMPGPPELATPDEQAQAALMLGTMNPATGLITAAPRAAVALGSIGAYLYGTGQANADNPEAVRQLQTKLRDAGLYSGAIDGKMGPATHRANQAFMAAEDQRVRGEQAAADKARADAETLRAEADTAETKRKGTEADTKARQRDEGQDRLRDVERNVPWYRQALRDYGSAAGYVGGAVLGPAVRAGVTKASNKLSELGAGKAEALFDTATKSIPNRVARVNEFWRRGGGEVPFVPTPSTAPGVAVNPSATAIDKLYQPPTKMNALTDLGITAGFAGESAIGQFMLSPQAREELHQAQEAVASDPSEVNISRLQAAKDRMAIADVMTNVGRAGAISYPASALKMQRSPTRPAMDKAEAERLGVERYLRRPTTGKKAAPSRAEDASESLGDILATAPRGTRLMQPDL